LAAALVGIAGVADSASAVTLPPGYDYTVSQTAASHAEIGLNNHQDSSTIGLVSSSTTSPLGTVAPGTASASGSIGILPSPHISAGGSVNFTTPPAAYNHLEGQYGSNASYSGVLIYYFEIGGPTSTVAVNAKAVASYSTSALPAGGFASGVINFNVQQFDNLGDPVYPLVIRDSTGSIALGSYHNPTAAQSGGFTENGTYNLFTNTVYQVALQVISQVAVFNAGDLNPSAAGGTASILASLDPTFNIASSVANAGDYSFVFSDGIGNTAPPVSPTPLPAALPFFAASLGALGLFGARRQRARA
jgi:hypothetical protein